MLLFIEVEEHCGGKSRNTCISVCIPPLPLHLWAVFPSSNSFPPRACSSGTQTGLEDWSVLDFHKSLVNIALFLYACHANSLTVGRRSVEPLSKISWTGLFSTVSQPGCHMKQRAETFSCAGGNVVTAGSCIPGMQPGADVFLCRPRVQLSCPAVHYHTPKEVHERLGAVQHPGLKPLMLSHTIIQ